MVLAMGTVAMSAGVWHIDLTVTFGALRQHLGAGLSTTYFHGRKRLAMGRQDCILVLIQEFSFKGMDDRREQNHLTFPQSMEKSFIRRLIACVALWLVLEVRWVYRDVVRMLR